MPKAVSCNAFYMFMVEQRKRLEARGERFPRGMEDVVGIAAEMWEGMTPEQKNIYKDKARDYKKSDEFSAYKKDVKARLPRQLKEDGGPRHRPKPRDIEEDEFVETVPLLYPSDDEEAIEEFRKKRLKDRTELMDCWKWNMSDRSEGICDMKCYVISFISHGHTGSYAYFPAEVAIAEFTLREGLKKTFWKTMGPHALPASLIPTATALAEVHKLPFSDTMEGMTDDFNCVFDEILRFCRPSKNLRRLYCISKEFNTIQGCVGVLQNNAKMIEIRPERINCVDDLLMLFCEWREKACAPAEWRTFNECDGMSESGSPFYQHPDFPCDYHKSVGVHRCALATVKRAVYYLIQRVLPYYHLESTPRHRPAPVPGDINDASAAAQFARAVQQAQMYAAGGTSDDTTTVATMVTRRPPPLHTTDRDDVVMPKTLPPLLRRFAGHEMPTSWKVDEAIVPPGTRQRRTTSSSADTVGPSGNTGRTTVLTGREIGSTAHTGIVWNQNKAVRDYIYGQFNLAGQETEHERGQADTGRERSQQGAIAAAQGGETYSEASFATMGTSRSGVVGSLRPRHSCRPSMRLGNSGGDGIACAVANMCFGPQPVVFPPPQKVATAGPPGFDTTFMRPRPRMGMPPRVSLPPGITTPAMRTTTTSITSATSSAAPPVKTQSRVKQMLAERLRQQKSGQTKRE